MEYVKLFIKLVAKLHTKLFLYRKIDLVNTFPILLKNIDIYSIKLFLKLVYYQSINKLKINFNETNSYFDFVKYIRFYRGFSSEKLKIIDYFILNFYIIIEFLAYF